MKRILILTLMIMPFVADAAYFDTISASQSGAWNVSILNSTLSTTVTSLPSITGTVTANLGTIAGVSTESTLSAINTKTPSLGQSTMTASVPVVLASNQSSIPVTGTFFQATQPVSIASMPSTPVTGTFWQTTQPVSIASSVAVTGPLTDTQIRATPLPISGTVTANTGLTQPLTDTQIRATPLPVSGSVTATISGTPSVSVSNFPATQAISAASLPLPTGASTSALQTSGNTSLSSIDTKLTTTANGLKVDNSANTQPVSAASLPLPAGASTETTLAAINTKTPSLGNQSQANSRPVTIADTFTVTGSAQSALNTDLLTGTVSGWYDAKSYHSVSIQVIGNAGILTGAVIFEQTNDTTNAPNGQPLMVFNSSSNALNQLLSATNPTASTNVVYEAPLLARYIRVRISTAFTGGTVQATANFSQMPYTPLRLAIQNGTASNVAVTANGTKTNNSVVPSNTNVGVLPALANAAAPVWTEGNQVTESVDLSGSLRVTKGPQSISTYSTAIVGLVPPATPTDIYCVTGSATKTVRITRIALTGTQTTAAQISVLVIKRSTANTGGTSSTVTAVPNDSNFAAATAVATAYTANPTALGTSIGTVRARKVFIGTTTSNSDEYILETGNSVGSSFVLRGTAQQLCINLNSVTATGNNFNVGMEWTEE